MDEFETIAADLEKSMKVEEVAADLMKSDEAKAILKDPEGIRKALAAGIQSLLKAKGAPVTDLSQEKKVKDDEVTDDEEDPAETPKKSGQGYKDSRPYVGKFGKGSKKADDDDDDDDGDDDGDMPSFFDKKKKGKKMPMKKGESDDDDDVVDITEFTENLGKAVDEIGKRLHTLSKAVATLSEGSAIFGQVLHQVAENDPRRDLLSVQMAKAIRVLVDDVKELKKSSTEHRDLIKSVAEMPGAPRVAGIALLKAEADNGAAAGGGGKAALSEGDRSRLFKAATSKQITSQEYSHAVKSGDASILTKVGK